METGEGDIRIGIGLAGHGLYRGQEAHQWGARTDQNLRIRRRILVLRSRRVHDRSKLIAEIPILRVSDEADDLVRSGSVIHAADPKSHSQRIFSGGEFFKAGLADDGDVGGAGAVVLVKVAIVSETFLKKFAAGKNPLG